MLWRWKKQTLVAQLKIQVEMIATAYINVQLDWLRDVISKTELGSDMTRFFFDDGLNCITTLDSGHFQCESRHLRLKYHTIHEAIAKGNIEMKHIAGMEMMCNGTAARDVSRAG